MKRGGKVVFLSHCLLNVNVKVMGLADYPGAVRGLIRFLIGMEETWSQIKRLT
jgi:hypothetical protein